MSRADWQEEWGETDKKMAEEFQNEIKAPVLKIFWIFKSLLTSAINLSDNGSFFKHSFLIYLVPQYLLILFYLNYVFFPPLFYIKVYAVRASKLSYSFC